MIQDGTRRRGRPPVVTREQIIDAVLRYPEPHLTMRAIATELGVTTQALYHYVRDSQDLIRLALDSFKRTWRPATDADEWRPWLRSFAMDLYTAALGSPAISHHLALRGGFSLFEFQVMDSAIVLLAREGLTPADAMQIYSTVVVSAFQWAERRTEIDRGRSEGDDVAVPFARRIREYADELRLLPQVVAGYTNRPKVEHFEFALELLLDGVQARIEAAKLTG